MADISDTDAFARFQKPIQLFKDTASKGSLLRTPLDA
jgi:hypothetical protein